MNEIDPQLAYRSATIRTLCEVCGEIADAPCYRCARPFCARHSPPEDERCYRCEALFIRRSRRWAAGSTFFLQLGVAVPYLIFGRPSVDSARWQARVRNWARRRFLKERLRRARKVKG